MPGRDRLRAGAAQASISFTASSRVPPSCFRGLKITHRLSKKRITPANAMRLRARRSGCANCWRKPPRRRFLSAAHAQASSPARIASASIQWPTKSSSRTRRARARGLPPELYWPHAGSLDDTAFTNFRRCLMRFLIELRKIDRIYRINRMKERI